MSFSPQSPLPSSGGGRSGGHSFVGHHPSPSCFPSASSPSSESGQVKVDSLSSSPVVPTIRPQTPLTLTVPQTSRIRSLASSSFSSTLLPNAGYRPGQVGASDGQGNPSASSPSTSSLLPILKRKRNMIMKTKRLLLVLLRLHFLLSFLPLLNSVGTITLLSAKRCLSRMAPPPSCFVLPPAQMVLWIPVQQVLV